MVRSARLRFLLAVAGAVACDPVRPPPLAVGALPPINVAPLTARASGDTIVLRVAVPLAGRDLLASAWIDRSSTGITERRLGARVVRPQLTDSGPLLVITRTFEPDFSSPIRQLVEHADDDPPIPGELRDGALWFDVSDLVAVPGGIHAPVVIRTDTVAVRLRSAYGTGVSGVPPIEIVHEFRVLPESAMTAGPPAAGAGGSVVVTRHTELTSRWPTLPVPVAASSGFPDSLQGALDRAMLRWNEDAPGGMSLFTRRVGPGAGAIEIAWDEHADAEAFRVVDPRSGEILEARVVLGGASLTNMAAMYVALASVADTMVRHGTVPWQAIAQYVLEHELGHALGLVHNMRASSAWPRDSLRSRAFTCRWGLAASVMDYARFNYIAEPSDGACLINRVGPFDRMAVATIYDLPLPAGTGLAGEYAFGVDDALDPGSHPELLATGDPVGSAAVGLGVLALTARMASEWWRDLDPSLGADAAMHLVGQWEAIARQLLVVARTDSAAAGGAIDLLISHYLSSPLRLEPLHSRIHAIRRTVVTGLLDPRTVQRTVDSRRHVRRVRDPLWTPEAEASHFGSQEELRGLWVEGVRRLRESGQLTCERGGDDC